MMPQWEAVIDLDKVRGHFSFLWQRDFAALSQIIRSIISYFGLHPLCSCDELGMTSSLLGHPSDERRAGPLPNPKSKAPAVEEDIIIVLYHVQQCRLVSCCLSIQALL